MLVNVFTEIKPHNIQQVADFGVDSLVDIINSQVLSQNVASYIILRKRSLIV